MEDLYDWVPAFSGDKTLSVEAFFEKLHSYCDFNDIGARKELLLAKHRCVGPAATVLSGKSFASTSDLRSALENAFCLSEEEAFNAFHQVKQDFLEPVTAYASRLCLAFQKTSLSGATFMLRTVFLQGLQPHLQTRVLSLAPASFEQALAKAKTVEADLHPVASTVAPASGSSQDPAVPAPRRRQRSHQQPQTSPVFPTPEPQLPYEALDFSPELLRTTEALQDLLQSAAASQGSPVVDDPAAASQLIHLDASSACRIDDITLQSFSSSVCCLLPSLDEALHRHDLPAAMVAQLCHCVNLLQRLTTILFPSSQSPQCETAPVEDDLSPAHQDPAEFPLTLRDSSNSLSAARPVEEFQPDLQPCQPAIANSSPAAARVQKSHAAIFNPAQQVPALPSDEEVMSSCMETTLTLLKADNPVQAVRHDAEPSEKLQSIGEVHVPDQLEVICNDAPDIPRSSASVRISSPNADLPLPHVPHLKSANVAVPASAANPRGAVMHCEAVIPAQTALPCTDVSPAASATLIKAGRGLIMRSRQNLGTVGILMIAGPAENRTVISFPIPSIASAASTLFHPAQLPAETCSKSAKIIIPHQSTNQSHTHRSAFLTFDPGGPRIRQDDCTSGDLIASKCPEHATRGWMPGTGIVLVCGRDSYNLFDADERCQGPIIPFFITAAVAFLQPSFPILVSAVSVIVLLTTFPSFTEPPDVG